MGIQVDQRAIRLIALFSGLIIVLPLGTYYVASHYYDAILSAVMAIVVVNMVLFTFVLLAFKEEDLDKKNK